MSSTIPTLEEKLDSDYDRWIKLIESRGKKYNSWEEVVNDPDLQDFPGKVEFHDGELILSPMPSGEHIDLQTAIFMLLTEHTRIIKLKGRSLFPSPIGDDKIRNNRIPDTGWASSERYKLLRKEDIYFKAPEICVEIDSPANKKDKRYGFEVKKAFYFKYDALEVWLCDQYNRTLKFHEKQNPDKILTKSVILPDFPQKIPETEDEIDYLIDLLQAKRLKDSGFL